MFARLVRLDAPGSDRWGIAASLLCAVHCALIPVLGLSLPLLGLTWLKADATGVTLIAVSAATALIALRRGFRAHQRHLPIALGIVGLGGLLVAEVIDGNHARIGLMSSLAGSTALVLAHTLNIRLCRGCPRHSNAPET